MYEIKDKASEMYEVFKDFAAKQPGEATEANFEQLGTILDRIRCLNIELERTVSNEYLDGLFSTLAPFVSGQNIIGIQFNSIHFFH